MIVQGQVICNLCGCSMGVLHVLPETDFHVCPDCYEASEPLPVQPEEAA